VAFIRRVRTGSGATAVQIAEYRGGRQRIVKHIGSAHTEAELGVLMEKAGELLCDPGQGVFDLDVEPVRPVVPLIGSTAAPELLSVPAPPVATAGRGRVVGTDSRLLFDALAAVYVDLGFGALADPVFEDLVIARIVEPTSLVDCGRVLSDLGQRPAGYATMKRVLARAAAGSYREQVAERCFAHASTHGDVSLVLYDVTTLYFEAEKEDGLRKVGYSKERRVDPQIIVGLLADRAGFPLEIGCYEGNKAETQTIVPIIKQFQARHHLAGLVVVADAGMLSASNLTDLEKEGLKFIVGSRSAKAPGDLESHFRWNGTAFTDGQLIDTITPKTSLGKPENNPMLRAEPVWDPEEHARSWRAVWAYSHKRALRDRRTLALQEERARAVVAGEKPARNPRFVKTTGDTRSIDEASLARAQKLVGLKGYVTNIPAGTLPAEQVASCYHDLWHVEQSFRMSKTDLAARPMFHRTRDAIEAHLTIVFTALAVSRTVQNRTGLSIRNVCRQLRPLRSATIAINGTTQTFPPEIPPLQQRLLDAIRGGSEAAH
jgi:hypothetical protein